jgi:hypothetical protein
MPPTSKAALLVRPQHLLPMAPLLRLTVAEATLPQPLHLLRLLLAALRVPAIDESLLCLKRKHHHAH